MAFQIFLMLVALLLWPCTQAVAYTADRYEPLLLDDDQASVPVRGNVRYLLESSPLLLDQLLHEDLPWQDVGDKTLNLAEEKGFVWVHFNLISVAQKENHVLHLDWPLFNHVELYVHDRVTEEWIQFEEASDWRQRHAFDDLPFYFRLQTPPVHELDVYLKLRASEAFLLPMTLYRADTYEDHAQQRRLLQGLFFGLLLAMLGYNFSLYIFVRDRNYAVYCIYVMSIGGYSLAVSGVGVAYIWSDWLWLANHSYLIFSCLSFITAAMFIRGFLNLPMHGGWPDFISHSAILMWFGLLLALLVWPEPMMFRLQFWAALGSPAIAFLVTLPLLLKGDVLARNLSIAWIPLLIATTVMMMHWMGWFSFEPWVMEFQRIGFAFEVLLLSIALAERINRERRERILAQEQSVEYYRQASEAKQREMLAQSRLLETERKARTELERRVDERTAELQQALSALEMANDELQSLSRTDGLTQVANRRHFDEVIEIELNRARRHGLPISLIMGDLDHFKQLNDRYGHTAGDECLRQTARIWREVVGRSHDLVARYGGEEFVVLLPGSPPEVAETVAEHIRQAINELEVRYKNEVLRFTCSLGVSGGIPANKSSPEALIATTDIALYRSKERGRNRVTLLKWSSQDIVET